MSTAVYVQRPEVTRLAETEQGAGRWRYPDAWRKWLFGEMQGAAGTAPRTHRRGGKPLALGQLHSMRRDEQGRFNDLSGGKPDFTPDTYEWLQQIADEMRAAGSVYNLTPPAEPAVNPCSRIDPMAIEEAIRRMRVELAPDYFAILDYFMTPASLRRFDADGFAVQLDTPTDRSGLFRRRHWACYAVWERLPLAERLKVTGP